jgi:ArsR family transcriptional regulator
MTYDKYAEICKALSDPTRAQIFDMLKSETKCACKILEEFNFTQPTLSYHMNMMVNCKLVDVSKVGKWNHYSINHDTLNELIGFLSERKE